MSNRLFPSTRYDRIITRGCTPKNAYNTVDVPTPPAYQRMNAVIAYAATVNIEILQCVASKAPQQRHTIESEYIVVVNIEILHAVRGEVSALEITIASVPGKCTESPRHIFCLLAAKPLDYSVT